MEKILALLIDFIKSQPKYLISLIKSLGPNRKLNELHILNLALLDHLFIKKGIEEEDYLAFARKNRIVQGPIIEKMEKELYDAKNAFLNANWWEGNENHALYGYLTNFIWKNFNKLRDCWKLIEDIS